MDNKKEVIQIKNVEKTYKLYDKPSDRVKEALGFGRQKKRHKEHFALKGIDINIYRGETVGIIGTNGSGKSTLLKIITGVLNPSKGDIHVEGRISALLELGAGFNREYNGIENVYLNGTMMGFSEKEIEERLDNILNFADIGNYVYQPVKTYSSGMFVRLAFAVAINIDPEILIVDEALSVGDVFFQAKCYNKFEEFKKEGKTILFVSHDLSSINKYCDRVILLNQGEKLGEGSAKEMIDIYKQVLVGQYVSPDQEMYNLLDDNDIRQAASGKMEINPDLVEYGSGEAVIVEHFITDEKDNVSNTILKGQRFSIHMRVKFEQDIKAPILAFTIKNSKGVEITGTNTMFEKTFFESISAGTEKEVIFTQEMNLQGGEYLLSLGVTGYEQDEFKVYHRLYDVLSIMVISDKDTVGYYDMNTHIEVR